MSSLKLRVDFDITPGLAATILGYHLQEGGVPPHTKPKAVEIIRVGVMLDGYNSGEVKYAVPKWVNQAKLILTNMRII